MRLRDRVRALLADQRVRYLLVGGTNTLVAYLVFSALWLGAGAQITYFGALYGSYAVASVLAFFLYEGFVFRTGRRSWPMFIRFQSVYVVSLAVNSVALPVAIEVLHWNPLVAQLVITALVTAISYLGHRFFSFRRPA